MSRQKPTLSQAAHYLKSRLGINIYDDPYQQIYVKKLIAPTHENQAIFLDAAAGTGKTSLAVAMAYYLLEKGEIEQIVYVRNAVSIREMGFLPGDIEEKEAPFMQPGLDVIQRLEPKKNNAIEHLIDDEKLVVTTTAFLRGVDWDGKKFLIIDEAQNLNLHEMQTVLTRPHDTTKVVVIGSSLQCDEAHKVGRYGIEQYIPFQLFAYHYVHATDLKVEQLTLKHNYRGKFSLMADQIKHSIKYLETDKELRNGKQKVAIPDDEESLNAAWETVGAEVHRR